VLTLPSATGAAVVRGLKREECDFIIKLVDDSIHADFD
jgi:hypothetical protein